MERHVPLIIGYDGSESARHAITRAGLLFAGRPAVVLYAWESLETIAAHHSVWDSAAPATLRDADAVAHRAAERVAAEGAALARAAGLDAEPRVDVSPVGAWETLVRVADETDAALIVLGARGLRGLRSLMLGSVSDGVAHHARQPVLIVPAPTLAEARRTHGTPEPTTAGTHA